MTTRGNVILDPLRRTDHDGVVELMTDPEARRYLGGPKSPAQAQESFGRFLEQSARGEVWAIRRPEDAPLLGMVFLDRHHDGTDQELSIMVRPAHWRRGYGAAAVIQLIDHAANSMGLTRLVAETQAANTPCRRLLEAVGMRLEREIIRFGEPQVIYAWQR